MRLKTSISIIIITFNFLIGYSTKNDKLNVVTRKIEREFELKEHGTLSVKAERGIISINSWEEKKVKVICRIIAKNQLLENAREEVNYMHYQMENKRSELLFQNYLVLPRNKSASQISSLLRVEYDIWVPDGIILDIENKFGSVTIENLNCILHTYLKFSDLSLNSVEANGEIEIKTGDLICTHSKLQANIRTRYSFIDFNNVKGNIDLNMLFGNIHVRMNTELSLVLTTDKSDIMILNRECYDYSMKLSGEYTTLRLNKKCFIKYPDLLLTNYREALKPSIWNLDYLKDEQVPPISIKANFGSLNLE